MSQDRSVKVNLKATVSDYIAKITAAKKATADFGKAAGESAKKNKSDWSQVGAGVAAAGAAIAVGVGYAVKTFVEFDSAMSAAAAGTNETGAALTSLREAAIKSGADTMFSATEAANAITEMGKAGVGAKDILSGGLVGALDLAAAGQLDVGRAAEIAATALNQFDLAGKGLPHVADLFAAAAGKAQGSVDDVALAMSYVGPVANAMNISIEDSTAVIGLLAHAGITGEKAGTGFRGMLLSLTAPSKIAKKAMDELGVQMYDSQGKFKGMRGAAGELQDKLGGLDEQTRNMALGQIFGNESLTAAIALYKGGAAGVDAWGKKVDDAGFAAKQAAKLTDNLKGDIERLGGSIDTVLIKGASGANAPLRSLTQGLEGAVNALGGVSPAIFNLGAATAGVALLGGAALIATPKIIAMKGSLDVLAGSSGRASIAVRGVAGAIGAATIAFIALPMLATAVSSAVGQLAPVGAEAGKALTDLATSGKASGDSADLLNRHWNDLGNTVNNVFSSELGHKASAFFSQISPGNLTGVETSETNQSIQFFKALDNGLADMVSKGNAEKAAVLVKRVTDEAKKQGYSLAQVAAVIPQYEAALAGVADAAAPAATAVDKTARASADLSLAVVSLGGNADSTASAMLLMGKSADAAKDDVKALAKVIEDDMSKAASAFAGATDVLGKYDPAAAAEKSKSAQEAVTAAEENAQNVRDGINAKKTRTVADNQAIEKADAAITDARTKTANDKAVKNAKNVRDRINGKRKASYADGQAIEKADDAVSKARTKAATARALQGTAGLEASYKASIIAGKTFAADIAEVTRRGLDPQVVTKLLQEGPEKAAPALETLLGKHSKQMIALVNEGEAQLSAINGRVVEQARLTSMAINATNDTMTADLGTAMAINAAKTASGGKITAQQLATQLKLTVPEVKRIAGEFGIGILDGVTAGVEPAKKKISGIATKLQQILDRDWTITVPVVASFAKGLEGYPGKAADDKPSTYANPLHRAGGGLLTGPGTSTSDSIPVLASTGEYWVQAAAVAKYGVNFFDQVNSMRFAAGGYVGSPSTTVGGARTTTYDQPVNITHATFTDGADLREQAAAERRTRALRTQ